MATATHAVARAATRSLAAAALSLTTLLGACGDGPTQPAASPIATPVAAIADTGTLAPRNAPFAAALEDALDRLVPALGEAAAAKGLHEALTTLRAADARTLGPALSAARGALARLPDDAASAPERDALRLVLDDVQAWSGTPAR